MLDFFAAKGLRAEVTAGIDLEQGVTLKGQRVSIGSGPSDDLRLGAADVVAGHLTLERSADGTGWEYFASDLGFTLVEGGNPRTGLVRPGLVLQLGQETRIELVRTALPKEAAVSGDTATPKDAPQSIPLPVALGVLAGIGALVFAVMAGLGQGSSSGPSLRTTSLITQTRAIEGALETCLAEPRVPTRPVTAADPAHAFWQVMTQRESDPMLAEAAHGELSRDIRALLTQAHLLAREGRAAEASDTLRRLEYVLPLGAARCPILAASRFDLALLELRGSR